MARNQGRINIGVGFNVDTTSLNNIKKTLQELGKLSGEQIRAAGGNLEGNFSKDAVHSWKNNLGDMRKELANLEKAFEAAFNPKLNTYEIDKFNASLQGSESSINRAFEALNRFGAQGQAALLDVTTNMLAVDRAAKQVDNTFKKLGDTMMNTIRWTVTSTAVNTVTGAIQQAYHYAQDLDRSLNDIRIVTGKSADDMNKFAREANKAAKALGAQTKDYTDASLIYYQQGLSDAEVKARTDVTVKAAAVTGQTADAVSSQLTAVWNGYKVTAQEAEKYVDKLAAVAASSAADLEELSTGMSQVASAANVMGVDVDSLNAQLATIVSVTREAPETIGTALKTVYARMSDIEAGLDTETTLGEYTSQMAQMGINVLDANGNLRDMGDVVTEIGNKWSSLNREQQVSLAQSIAGTRQYSRMMALFDNWNMYQEQLNVSMNATNTLNEQHLTYLESTEAHMNKLKAASEGLYDSIFDSEDINGVVDGLAKIVELIDQGVQTIGGLPGILTLAGMLFMNISKQALAEKMVVQQNNKLAIESNQRQAEQGRALLNTLNDQATSAGLVNKEWKESVQLLQDMYNLADKLTDEQWNELAAQAHHLNNAAQAEYQIKAQGVDTQHALQKQFQDSSMQFKRNEETNFLEVYSSEKATKPLDSSKVRKKLIDLEKTLTKKQQERVELEKLGNKLTDQQKKQLEDVKKAEEKIVKETQKKYEQQLYATKAVEEYNEQVANAEAQKAREKELADLKAKQMANQALASAYADLSAALSTVTFGAQAAGAAVSNMIDGNVLQGLTGLATGATSLGIGIANTGKAISSVKKAAQAGTATWSMYWAAATMGIALVITVITSVIEVITSLEKKKQEAIDQQFETIEKTKEEINNNLALIDSYEKLYEEYKKTGVATTELKNAALAVAEALGIEGAGVLILGQRYDELTKKINEAKHAENERKRDTISAQRNQAERQVNRKIKGITNDKKNGDSSGAATWHVGGGTSLEHSSLLADDLNEAIRKREKVDAVKELVQDEFEKAGLPRETAVFTNDPNAADAYKLKFKFEDTPANRAKVYTALNNAIQALQTAPSDTVDTTLVNEIVPSLQKIVSDKTFAQGAQELNSAIVDEVTLDMDETAAQAHAISIDSGKYTSADYKQTRQEMIDNAVTKGMSKSQAEALATKTLESQGGLVQEAGQKYAWVNKYANGSDGTAARLDDLDTVTWEAFASLDPESYKDQFGALKLQTMIKAAKAKAAEQRELSWANQSEKRLASLATNITDSERAADKLIGIDRSKELGKQIDLLEQQHEIVVKNNEIFKNELDTKITEVAEQSKELGLEKDINLLLQERNFEEAQAIVSNSRLNETAKKTLQDRIVEIMESTQKVVDIEQQELELTDAITEKRKEQAQAILDAYSSLRDISSSMIEAVRTQIEITQLLQGEDADVSDFQNTLVNLTNAQLENSKNELQSAAAIYEEAKATNDFDADTVEALSTMLSSHSNAMNAALETINEANEKHIAAIKASLQDVQDLLFGSTTNLSLLRDKIEWNKEKNEETYDAQNIQYQKKELEREFDLAAASASTAAAQEKILKLRQDVLTPMLSAAKLSEREVAAAREQLELEQLRIALIEAQENKTKMQLVRGTDGTYSYEYVADNKAIEEAEKAVADKENEIYNNQVANIENTLDKWLADYEKFEEISLEYGKDGLTEEEKTLLQERFTRLGSRKGELGEMLQEFATKYTEGDTTTAAERFGLDETFFAELGNTVSSDTKFDEFVTKITNSDQARVTAIQEAQDNIKSINELLTTALEGGTLPNMSMALMNLDENLAKITKSMGLGEADTGTLANGIKALRSTGQQTGFKDNSSAYVQDSEMTYYAITGHDEAGNPTTVDARKRQGAWDGEEVQILGGESYFDSKGVEYTRVSYGGKEYYIATDVLSTQRITGTDAVLWDKTREGKEGRVLDWAGEKNPYGAGTMVYALNDPTEPNYYFYKTKTLDSGLDGVEQRGDEGIESETWVGESVQIASDEYFTNDNGTKYVKVIYNKGAYYLPDYMIHTKRPVNIEQENGWVSVRGGHDPDEFDTGGYTGEWGSSGKLAMLHEKEIVLNKHDTANFLSAIEILRSLNMSMLSNVRAMNAVSAPVIAPGTTGQTIEQHIDIHADFPNVSDSNEILEAFDELAALAIQHAYENKL